MLCNKCKKKNIGIAKYCKYCGNKFDNRFSFIRNIPCYIDKFFNTITFNNKKNGNVIRIVILSILVILVGYFYIDRINTIYINDSKKYILEKISNREYLVKSNSDTVYLDISDSKGIRKIKIDCYDYNDNLVSSKNVKDKKKIKIDNDNSLSYYKIYSSKMKNKFVIVYFMNEEINEKD